VWQFQNLRKFKSTKFEEIWWTYVGLINIFRGSFFWGGSPCSMSIAKYKSTCRYRIEKWVSPNGILGVEGILHTSRKIVNDSHTFILRDFPDLCCLQFTNCLRIVRGVQAWWMRYVAVLMKFWASLGRRRGIDRDEQWFRQDGATPHTTDDSLAWLSYSRLFAYSGVQHIVLSFFVF
jgi:hypothetical protein